MTDDAPPPQNTHPCHICLPTMHAPRHAHPPCHICSPCHTCPPHPTPTTMHDPPPLWTEFMTHAWEHYLSATTVADGNKEFNDKETVTFWKARVVQLPHWFTCYMYVKVMDSLHLITHSVKPEYFIFTQ